jgi:hypothetical protein
MWGRALTVHACNPSYLGGRDQLEQIVRETLSRKYQTQQRAGGVAQGIGPEFKSQY